MVKAKLRKRVECSRHLARITSCADSETLCCSGTFYRQLLADIVEILYEKHFDLIAYLVIFSFGSSEARICS